MIDLFPLMRSEQVNRQSVIVAHRAMRICEMLHQAHRPVRANTLQAMLEAAGEAWAQDRAGYMLIWQQLQALRDAGLIRKVRAGFEILDDQHLTDAFANAITNSLKESIPVIGPLNELRDSLMRVALHYAVRTMKRTGTDGQTS